MSTSSPPAVDPLVTADWYLYASPDNMENWHLDPAHMVAIKQIYTIYAFDRNSVTHCCEFTPSYAMYPADLEVAFKPQYYDEEYDRLREEIEQQVRVASIDNPAVYYYHCDGIDRALKNHPERLHSLGLFDRADVSDEDAFEGARDQWNSNPPNICR